MHFDGDIDGRDDAEDVDDVEDNVEGADENTGNEIFSH